MIIRVLAVLLLVAISSACGTANTGSGRASEATPTTSPGLTATLPEGSPSPAAPLSVNVNVDSIAQPPEDFGADIDLILTGHVTKILPAEWNTPNGQRPADPEAAVSQSQISPIITPVILTLDSPPVVDRVSADLSSNQVVMVQFGGQVGADSVTVFGTPAFQLGVHVLVFLSQTTGPNGTQSLTSTSAGPAWDVVAAYTLTDDGNVIVNGKNQPAAALIARLKAAAGTHGTPTP
jgi:hypothetical protein